jgi:hypothetical protein
MANNLVNPDPKGFAREGCPKDLLLLKIGGQ